MLNIQARAPLCQGAHQGLKHEFGLSNFLGSRWTGSPRIRHVQTQIPARRKIGPIDPASDSTDQPLLNQLQIEVQQIYGYPAHKQSMNCLQYERNSLLDAKAKSCVFKSIPCLNPQELLLLAHSFSCIPGTQPDLGLAWGVNLDLQQLVLEHAIPRWLDGHYPDSSGMSKPIEVTSLHALPEEVGLYWLRQVLTRIKDAYKTQGGGVKNMAYATLMTRNSMTLHCVMNGLHFCALDDGSDVSLVGFCLTEDRSTISLGETTIIWIESFLPPGSGVGGALVASLKQQGHLTTAFDCVAESMGFWLKMGKVPSGLIMHKLLTSE